MIKSELFANFGHAHILSIGVRRFLVLYSPLAFTSKHMSFHALCHALPSLNELDRLAVNGARAGGAGRGSQGAVAPKYRNPENPTETWAERGLKPRWLAAALKSGKKLEDFSIEASGKSPRAARKKTAKH